VSDLSIRLRGGLVGGDPVFARRQGCRLAAGQCAGLDALVDPLRLVVLPLIDPRRCRIGKHRRGRK